MSKHRKSEWERLTEALAQAEYERDEARRMWTVNRERADWYEQKYRIYRNAFAILGSLVREAAEPDLAPLPGTMSSFVPGRVP